MKIGRPPRKLFVSRSLDVLWMNSIWNPTFVEINDDIYCLLTDETFCWLKKFCNASDEKRAAFGKYLKECGLSFKKVYFGDFRWPQPVILGDWIDEQAKKYNCMTMWGPDDRAKRWSTVHEFWSEISDYMGAPELCSKSQAKEKARAITIENINHGYFDYLGDRESLLMQVQKRKKPKARKAAQGGVFSGDVGSIFDGST